MMAEKLKHVAVLLTEISTVINKTRNYGTIQYSCHYEDGIATCYGLENHGVGVRVRMGARIFTSPCRPDRLWGPPNLLSNVYLGLFSRG
jgi:hypothetical protein